LNNSEAAAAAAEDHRLDSFVQLCYVIILFTFVFVTFAEQLADLDGMESVALGSASVRRPRSATMSLVIVDAGMEEFVLKIKVSFCDYSYSFYAEVHDAGRD